MFKKLKKVFKNKKKSLIKVRINEFELVAPADHKIEVYLKEFRYYSRNLPRIAKYIESRYEKYNILDVGANIGDSIALFRSMNVKQHIYAVEGEMSFFGLLQKNIKEFSDVTVFNYFLGDETKQERLVLDVSKGTGKLTATENETIEVKALDEFVKENNLKDIKLLKIDTDGFDLKILRGGFATIRLYKPILFFEYDAVYLTEQGDNGILIFEDLAKLGYSKILYYDNFGKFLISITTADTAMIKQLYAYIAKHEGAFPYFDVCLFHESDDELAEMIIQKELEFFS